MVGLGVIAFMLFGLVMLVIGVFGVLSDARDSLKDRADDIRGQRAEKRRRAEWKAERATAEARHLVATFDGPSPLSVDGRLVVSLLSTDEISEPYRESRRWTFSLWDTHARERRRTWADAATSFGPAASVSPDGRHFAVEVREFRPAQDHPNVVGHERTVVRLYETATGALIGTLPIVPRFLVFTPDGEKLFTVETEGVKLWRV